LWTWAEDYGWIILILLVAAALRFHDLAQIPPGLTHDEADHGLTAWQIASDGLRGIYFTIGYGREPLYDYAVALLMTFMGPTILAGRLTSAFASLIMIAAMTAWVKLAFDRPTSLLTGAGLAVGFWPLMSGRQALRSILLPTLFVIAVLLFWRALKGLNSSKNLIGDDNRLGLQSIGLFAAAGVIFGLTFYTYIPARALWIVLPLLLLYWLVKDRCLARAIWWRIGVMLLIMLIVALPLLVFLQANPEAEVRIRQLAQPLQLARQGDWHALADSSLSSLRLFFIEGDPAWRYNIYKRPFLTPVFGILFVLGLAQTAWWAVRRRDSGNDLLGSASFLSLSWLVVGFLPALVTGPALSMTQAIAVQPLIYLFPAVVLAVLGREIAIRFGDGPRKVYAVGVVTLFVVTALVNGRAYFQTWANHPEVRVQYETTLATAIEYLNSRGAGEATVSTITPHPYHSPAVAQMLLKKEDVNLRWFDGRGSLLLPRVDRATVIIPGFTPLPNALNAYFETAELTDTLPMRESDLDRPVRIYAIDRSRMAAAWQDKLTPVEASFDGVVELTGYASQPAQIRPGDQVTLVTQWLAREPLKDAVFFTHLLDQTGAPAAQADRLDYPGSSWAAGDQFLQLHTITVPDGAEPGEYTLAVGVYTLPEGKRLAVTGGDADGDLLPITTLTVVPR
jgi:hypothetical protein